MPELDKNILTTNFERAIFFSWYCSIRDCAFCYMSTQPKSKKTARRSTASILAEVLITKKLGWELGFFSGGIGAYKETEFKQLIQKVHKVYGQKIWINVGPLTKNVLIEYKPFIKGVVGSIETVNEDVHKKVCPSKPIKPYLNMFKDAQSLALNNAMTIIIGLGETIQDFPKLKSLIAKYKISKIHFYCLNPQKATIFENTKAPSVEYQAEWIRLTRQSFPDIDIQAGIWEDKVDRVATLLKAGANSISKFPAIKLFGSKQAKQIEHQSKQAGFEFISTLTKLPNIDWNAEADKLELSDELKGIIKIKLHQYLNTMSKHNS